MFYDTDTFGSVSRQFQDEVTVLDLELAQGTEGGETTVRNDSMHVRRARCALQGLGGEARLAESVPSASHSTCALAWPPPINHLVFSQGCGATNDRLVSVLACGSLQLDL